MSLQHNGFPPESIAREALFGRLARGHAERLAVLTPNRRLAQSLQSQFAAWQVARGERRWETADILPFAAFVERLWEDALHAQGGASLPLLATASQQQALWEEAIGAQGALISVPVAAAQCREAWVALHAWRLAERFPAQAAGEDAQAFLEWSRRYAHALRERSLVDAAQLPDRAAPLLVQPGLRKPAAIVLYGFDILTPQAADFLGSLAARGCALLQAAPEPRRAKAVRVELVEAKDELAAAARWARARVEQGAARIGIVVPDLAAHRAQVHRALAAAMRPACLVERTPAPLPFELSLGKPLAQVPLVADALRLLALTGPQASFADASRALRSPFIAGAEAERGVRARLDARLRERAMPSLALETLLRLCRPEKAPRAPVLVDRLERLAAFRKSDLFGARPASQWARAFSEALRIAGFPGERALDSEEHQALARWHELLAEFAVLERLGGKLGFVAALQRLQAMAQEAVFQPEGEEVPVRVMGILESAGQQFDALWVMGLTDEAWPLPVRPVPFLPVALQRAAGIPQADAASSLALDRRITGGWLSGADEVVVSSARRQKESELAPSPLIAALPLAEAAALAPPVATLAQAQRARAALESLDDGVAPRVTATSLGGGTRVFQDQAACPFRAVARHRMGSKPLEAPAPGLDARHRGILVHEMMRAVWQGLGNRERLLAIQPGELTALLEASATEAIACVARFRAEPLAGRFGRLEHARLVKLAREWLDRDRERDDFEVVATEEKRAVTVGGLGVNVKLDRLDRTANGHVVIDYKTGHCRTGAWMGDRPEEPQVPMYAASLPGEVGAVAFAVVKSGECRFRGISRVAGRIPEVCTVDRDRTGKKHYRDWDAMMAGWRAALESLGRGFAAGDARVDPKHRATCDTCDQHVFCRIAERAPFGTVEGEGASDE